MIYFLHIGYDGSPYSGWQYQPNAPSVQEAIEKKLKRIFKKDITVYGCGRTDTGVHASQYMLHIHLDDPLDFDLKFRLNKNLPDQIAVYDVLEMEPGRHARYDASTRTYDYFIHLYKDPILSNYSSHYSLENLDFASMKRAASILANYTDFRAICKQPDLHNHTRCTVSHARLFVAEDEQRLRFTITANRFLRGMVRLCVSFLLRVGTREMSCDEFEEILANQIELPNKRPAIANGLYLTRIEYPYLQLPNRDDLCRFLKLGLEDE